MNRQTQLWRTEPYMYVGEDRSVHEIGPYMSAALRYRHEQDQQRSSEALAEPCRYTCTMVQK